MKKNKLFLLLSTLSKKELFAFSKYIKQQHKNEKVALPVFFYIRKFYPAFEDEKKLNIPYIHQKIFGIQEYNRKKVLNAFSDLHLWLKDFLMQEKIKSDKFIEQVLWLGVLQDRGLDSLFSQYSKKLIASEAAIRKNSSNHYLKNMIAHFIFYAHQIPKGKKPDNVAAFKNHSNTLDSFYRLAKLKIACEMANLNNLFATDFDFAAMPDTIENIIFDDLHTHPLLSIYSKIYQLLAKRQFNKYAEIEKFFKQKKVDISTEEMHIIHSYLHNYAAMQIRRGNEDFWEKMHQLNKLGLEYKIFTKKGVMSSTQFNNIVNIACKVKDFSWTASFIKQQSQYLYKNIRSAAISLAEANMFFEKNDFQKALSLLESVKAQDIRQIIRLKAFKLRCYYEIMEDDNVVFDYCNAFEAFLQRNRKPKKEIVEATLNFSRMVKKLIQKKLAREKLLAEISNITPIYFKTWLLKKADYYKPIK